jgi:hypothetical protein
MILRRKIFTMALAGCIFFIAAAASCYEIPVKSVEGTQNDPDGLTIKQAAIQRWLAGMTYLDRSGDGWNGWYIDPKQLGLESTRYSLAFIGYAAAGMAYKTPAYREVSAAILDDVISRLLEKRTWQYIETYWKNDPHFPDPVAYENIMYSGHLAQMIALYESITGDTKYDTQGFDFVWSKDKVIHYTAKQLMQAMYDQVQSDPRGGIPCEPDTIFIICNDHPQNAFVLYDSMHGTHFSDLQEKWRKWMEANGTAPTVKGKSYLKISYLRKNNMWTTGAGVPGSDGWALAWMYPWTSNLEFVQEGCRRMHDSSQWRTAKSGGQYLKSDAMAAMFGVDDAAGTSFYPLAEQQCGLRDLHRTPEVFRWYENISGSAADLDNDGFNESYFYNTDKKFFVWTTGNLALAMVAYGDSVRKMLREPFYKQHAGEPYLAHAPYPDALVQRAVYDAKALTLSFTLLKGVALDITDAELVCRNMTDPKSVTVNGTAFTAYSFKDGVLTLKTPVTDGMQFVIQL